MNTSIEQKAIEYLSSNKKKFFKEYLNGFSALDEKLAFFTAGPSGAGKTEFAQQLLEIQTDLVHLDIDVIRDFFAPVGYNGSNSTLFQKPASRGVQFLFDEIVKHQKLSFVLDSNLSHFQTAKENMIKLLKHEYKVEIFYIYNHIERCFSYTKHREAVTKRVVSEAVFFESVINSRKTTYEIKNLFKENTVLNVIDKRANRHYEDISSKEFYEIIPSYTTGETR